MPQLLGGTGDAKEATADIQKFCDELRSAVEEKVGKSFEAFEAKIFKSQVVAGANYFVKVHIGAGSFLHLRIYRDLQGNLNLHGVQEQKTEADPVEYFQ